MAHNLLAHNGHIAQVLGLQVGHFTHPDRPTGCSVVLCPQGATAGVDVRGGAPGTRETDLLHPSHLVQQVHGITLAGGSAWGLDAASGTARWLEEQGAGLDIGVGRLPLVPAAVLFDLTVGDMRIRPDAAAGYAACQAASRSRPAEGSVGAGAGALVGKIFGFDRAMQGGIGTASFTVHGVTVGALIACNAVGDVYHPRTGQLLAGCRSSDGRQLLGARDALLQGYAPQSLLAGSNTTIGVVATDMALTKAQAQRLATVGHDGLARAINPVHTMSDGDTLFALGTGQAPKALDAMTLFTLAAEAVAIATARAVLLARALPVAGQTPAPQLGRYATMSVIKPDSTPSTGVRLDKWLWAARFFKTRSLAAEEIHKGRVSVNGSTAKAAREVCVGDTIALRQGNMPKTVVVRGISGTRGPASVAQLLYYETEESQQQRLQLTVQRRLAPEPAAAISQQRQGRPTKRQRRALDQARTDGNWGDRWSARWE